MTDWDRGRIYFADSIGSSEIDRSDSNTLLQKNYLQFLQYFRIDESYVYR